jgi:hypothetical protein
MATLGASQIMITWNSVAKKEPKDASTVLCFGKQEFFLAHYDCKYFCWRSHDYDHIEYGKEYEVEYWSELPEAPVT